MQLFVDTNVYLSFFHFAKDDLDQLKKAVEILKNTSELQLIVPTQVMDEFSRNRDGKIADALKQVRQGGQTSQYPALFHNLDDYNRLRQLQEEAAQLHQKLLQEVEVAAQEQTLLADALIAELFELATRVKVDSSHVTTAVERRQRGNPPGKDDSIGDAIIWESLIAALPQGEDLHFVAADKDWTSPLGGDAFNAFLQEEWKRRKRSDIVYYPLLTGFFAVHYPQIKLSMEAKKELLILDLAQSGSFAQTHTVVASLAQLSDFSAEQLNAIVAACLSNSQVSPIITDSDVKAFLERALSGRDKDVDFDSVAFLRSRMKEER